MSGVPLVARAVRLALTAGDAAPLARLAELPQDEAYPWVFVEAAKARVSEDGRTTVRLAKKGVAW